jgi:hypothetical protein
VWPDMTRDEATDPRTRDLGHWLDATCRGNTHVSVGPTVPKLASSSSFLQGIASSWRSHNSTRRDPHSPHRDFTVCGARVVRRIRRLRAGFGRDPSGADHAAPRIAAAFARRRHPGGARRRRRSGAALSRRASPGLALLAPLRLVRALSALSVANGLRVECGPRLRWPSRRASSRGARKERRVASCFGGRAPRCFQ